MRTENEVEAFFEDHDDEFLKFDAVKEKLHARPDVHAFLLLDRLVPGKGDMIQAAEHDEIWLETEVEKLGAVATDDQLLDLIRCGVRVSDGYLCMFV